MLSLGVGLGSIAFWGMVLFMGKMSWLAGGMVFLSGTWIYLALKRCNWMSGPGESEDGDE